MRGNSITGRHLSGSPPRRSHDPDLPTVLGLQQILGPDDLTGVFEHQDAAIGWRPDRGISPRTSLIPFLEKSEQIHSGYPFLIAMWSLRPLPRSIPDQPSPWLAGGPYVLLLDVLRSPPGSVISLPRPSFSIASKVMITGWGQLKPRASTSLDSWCNLLIRQSCFSLVNPMNRQTAKPDDDRRDAVGADAVVGSLARPEVVGDAAPTSMPRQTRWHRRLPHRPGKSWRPGHPPARAKASPDRTMPPKFQRDMVWAMG